MNLLSEIRNNNPENPVTTRVSSPRLGQYPWSSALLIQTSDIPSAFEKNFAFEIFLRRLQEYEDKVLFGPPEASHHDLLDHAIRVRKMLCVEVEHSADSQTVTVIPKSMGDLTIADVQVFASLLTAYRLADVLALGGVTGAAPPNPRRFPKCPHLIDGIKLDPFDHLHDWVEALKESNKIPATSSAPTSHKLPYVEMLKAMRLVNKTTQRGRILKNLLLAAFHLDLLNRTRRRDGNGAEIPCLPDIPDSLDALMSGIRDEDGTANGGFNDTDMLWLKDTFTATNVSQYRVPLQLALAISPVVLLLPLNLVTKKHGKLAIIKYFHALGNERPQSLQLVEAAIWRVLVEASVGRYAALQIRYEIMKRIPWDVVETCTDADRRWFQLSGVAPPIARSESVEAPAPCLTVDPMTPSPSTKREINHDKAEENWKERMDHQWHGYRVIRQPAARVDDDRSSFEVEDMASWRLPPRPQSLSLQLHSSNVGSSSSPKVDVASFEETILDSDQEMVNEPTSKSPSKHLAIVNWDGGSPVVESAFTNKVMGTMPSSVTSPRSRLSVSSVSLSPPFDSNTSQHPVVGPPPYQTRATTGHLPEKVTPFDFGLRIKQAKTCAKRKTRPVTSREDKSLDVKRIRLMTSDQKEEVIHHILEEPLDSDGDDGWVLEADFRDHRVIALGSNLSPRAPSAKKHIGTAFEVWTDRGELKIVTPCFHDTQDLVRLEFFMDVCKQTYFRGIPHHVSSPDQSMFEVMPFREYRSLDFHQLNEKLVKRHLVILDMPWEELQFDASGLRSLAPLNSIVPMHDLSIPTRHDLNASLVNGRVKDLLEAAREPDGKFVNAPSFPFVSGETTTLRFSTDMAAWASNSGILYTTHQAIPFGHIRWGLASTGGTMTWNHVDSDGFATFIDVRCGSKLWFVHKELENRDNSIGRFLDGKFSLIRPIGVLEPILLMPGTRLIMRPNTLHTVFTEKPSICHGGHFYATGTLAYTFSSLIHSFVCDRLITNVSHPETRILLRRIMHMIHRGLVMNAIDPEDPDYLHLPQVMSPGSDIVNSENVLEVLAICTLSIMGNVLDPRTYITARNTDSSVTGHSSFETRARETFDINSIPTSERGEISYARAVGWQTLKWFNTTYDVYDLESAEEVDLAHQYLIHFASSLVEYKLEADNAGVVSAGDCALDDIVVQLDSVMEVDPLLFNLWRNSRGYQLWFRDASDASSDSYDSNFATSPRHGVSQDSASSSVVKSQVMLDDLSGYNIIPTGRKFNLSKVGSQHGITRLDDVFMKAKAKMGAASTDWARALFEES